MPTRHLFLKAINATPNMVKAVMAAMAASSGRLSPARKKEIRQEKKKIIFSVVTQRSFPLRSVA